METPLPTRNAQFYLLFQENMTNFTADFRSEALITFSLSTGIKFPVTMEQLAPIMEKTEQYFNWETILLGKTQPSCGASCDCSNCDDLIEYCRMEGCKGFTASSIDRIACSKTSCLKSNVTNYYILPLFPLQDSLPHYDPKFKFIKRFPATKIENKQNMETVKNVYDQPDAVFPTEVEPTVLFSVSYPSLQTFNTTEKFNEIYEKCKFSNLLFILLGEDRYVQHNDFMLQQIINSNKDLSSSLMEQDLEQVSEYNLPIKEKHRLEMMTAPPSRDNEIKDMIIASLYKDPRVMGEENTIVKESYIMTNNKKPPMQIFLIIVLIILSICAAVALYYRFHTSKKNRRNR